MTECGCQPVTRYLIAVDADQPVRGVTVFGVYGTLTCHTGSCRKGDEVQLDDFIGVKQVWLTAVPAETQR